MHDEAVRHPIHDAARERERLHAAPRSTKMTQSQVRAKTATGTQVPGPLTKTRSGDAVQIRWTHAKSAFSVDWHRAPKALAESRARDRGPARRRQRRLRQLALGLGSTCCVGGRGDERMGRQFSNSKSIMSRSISAVWPPLPRTTSVFIFFGSRVFVAVAAAARAAPMRLQQWQCAASSSVAQRWNRCIKQQEHEGLYEQFRLVLWQLWQLYAHRCPSSFEALPRHRDTSRLGSQTATAWGRRIRHTPS